MARISTSVGGTGQQGAPQPQGEWRQPQQYARQPGVDWADPQYASPHPSRNQRFGSRRQRAPVDEVPQLPERKMSVKAKGLGTYYTLEGTPIGEEFVSLPISPGLIQAVKDGDLERGPDPKDATQPLPRRPRHNPGPMGEGAE